MYINSKFNHENYLSELEINTKFLYENVPSTLELKSLLNLVRPKTLIADSKNTGI